MSELFSDTRLGKKDIIMFILVATSKKEMVEIMREVLSELKDQMLSSIQLSETSDDLLTLEETAQFLKVTKATIHNWQKEGRITASRLGGRVYFSKLQLLSQFKCIVKFK